MIEVKFTGANMDVLRRQMAHFLEEMDAPVPQVTQPIDADPLPEPVPSAPAEPEVSSSEPGSVETEVGIATTVSDASAMNYDDDIKPRMLQLSLKKGREAVFKVLGAFNVANTQDVPPDKWPELVALINELLES